MGERWGVGRGTLTQRERGLERGLCPLSRKKIYTSLFTNIHGSRNKKNSNNNNRKKERNLIIAPMTSKP